MDDSLEGINGERGDIACVGEFRDRLGEVVRDVSSESFRSALEEGGEHPSSVDPIPASNNRVDGLATADSSVEQKAPLTVVSAPSVPAFEGGDKL